SSDPIQRITRSIQHPPPVECTLHTCTGSSVVTSRAKTKSYLPRARPRGRHQALQQSTQTHQGSFDRKVGLLIVHSSQRVTLQHFVQQTKGVSSRILLNAYSEYFEQGCVYTVPDRE
ncbi:unnamed protein product, partial [Ectocarpus sp. 13 AM-2016]